ncbi:hypothetical protein RHMOL_Rhmol10G0210000 [Rhododendron molle]|uniref:Uncharacterized protein n=1 Tax=Rhododendron molle TaxID=49168 RepID=A0ACC0M539_RHOML|nr:hypothetical protein RHMOL_Rhmol10G0210000 [Rhododendron molle]
MTLHADGIFRVYLLTLDSKGNWSVMWRLTNDKCGLNAFCTMNDIQADCRCLPGFNFINPEDCSFRCLRNLTAVSCDIANGGSVELTKTELESMLWEDQSYEVSVLPSKQDCRQSCLEDCLCEVAFYSEGKYCQKQMLPLRYGRRLLSSSQVAFVKVPKGDDQVLAPKGTKKELRLECWGATNLIRL